MTERRALPWSNLQLLALAVGLFGATCVFHLGLAAMGKSLYRDNHLGTSLEYARGHIDLLNPVMVGFNATGTPTPQEFPFWQAAAGLVFKVLGTWFGWANLVSLVLFGTCLYPLFQTARIYSGTRAACWTLIFFLAEPLIFLNAGMAATDGFALASAVWFLFFSVKLLQTPSPAWWALTFLAGTVAALSKLPFFLATGLAVFFLTVFFHRTSVRAWVSLGTAAVLIGLIFRAWTAHTDACVARAEFTYVDLRVSNPAMTFWYFGDWHYRLSAGNWGRGAWRILNACFGSFALAGMFAGSLLFVRQPILGRLWLAGAAMSTLVFTHLVLHHWHYYLMFTPAVALICAQTAVAWEKHVVFDSQWKARMGMGVVALTLLLSIAQGLVAMRITLLMDPYDRNMAKLVKQYTRPADKVLIGNGGWGGDVLFLSGRQGLSIWDTKLLEDPKAFRRLKELGYGKLILISDSPQLTATMASTAGEAAQPRQTYLNLLTDVARDWPVVYQDDNILIKTIP